MVVPLMKGQGFEAMPAVPDVTRAEEVVDGVVEDRDVFVGVWVVSGLLVLCCLRVSLTPKKTGRKEALR